MRYFPIFFILLLSVGAWAGPLKFPGEDKRAQPFTVTVGGDWISSGNAMAYFLQDPDYAPNYPVSLSGYSEYDRDNVNLVDKVLMVERMQGKQVHKEVKLGKLRALVERRYDGFSVISSSGTTKFVIDYKDGRDVSKRTPFDSVLQEVLNSFSF
jgi:hypothetical protein